MSRRLSGAAVALIFIPFVIEAVALRPSEFQSQGEPLSAALRMAAGGLMPYLAVALAAVVLAAWLGGRTADSVLKTIPRISYAFLWAAFAVAVAAALVQPSLKQAILSNDAIVHDRRIQLGWGRPFGPWLTLETVPIENAGALIRQALPPVPAPYDALVRFYCVRLARNLPKNRIELVGGGETRDITQDLARLNVNEGRFFSYALRVGPGAGTVQLRAGKSLIAPVPFFDASLGQQAHELALNIGGDDEVYEAESSGKTLNPPLIIVGRHNSSGYSVFVLAAKQWARQDLSSLLNTGGALEIRTRVPATLAPPWTIQLVTDNAHTDPIALSSFTLDSDSQTYRIALDKIEWRNVSPSNVGGIAFRYAGPPGAFRLSLDGVGASQPRNSMSGYAIGASASLNPDMTPGDALFAVGKPGTAWPWTGYAFLLRFLAAALCIVGLLSSRLTFEVLDKYSIEVTACFLGSLALADGLYAVLPSIIEPRLTHMPVLFSTLGLGVALAARRSRSLRAARQSPVSSPKAAEAASKESEFGWITALKAYAVIGVIAIHATADSAGLPYAAFPPHQRIAPAILRALALTFNYQIFLVTAFFLMAHSLTRRPRTYAEMIRDRTRRLIGPFLFWTFVFLAFRHWKAHVFGYEAFYRRELADLSSWAAYFLLGSAQYHLHFLPLLFGLILFYPVFTPALTRPWLGAGIFATFACLPFMDRQVYIHVASPALRPFVLRATQIFSYLGYGLLAFSLYGIQRRGLSSKMRRALLFAAIITAAGAYAALIRLGLHSAELGRWAEATFSSHMATCLLPAAAFLFFYLNDKIKVPKVMRSMARVSYGIYLVHPLFLDAMEILEKGTRMSPAVIVTVNIAVVATAAWALSLWIDRSPMMAWTIGGDKRNG